MEEWKCIIGFENYKISNFGRAKNKNDIILKQGTNKKGYKHISLNYKGKNTTKTIHRLVGIHFKSNPNNYPVVMHLDNDPSNNNDWNIKWGTYQENNIQRFIDNRANNNYQNNHPDLGKIGKYCRNSKRVNQYTKDGTFIKTWDSIMDVQRELGIANTQISSCCLGKKNYKYAGGFAWKYYLPLSPNK